MFSISSLGIAPPQGFGKAESMRKKPTNFVYASPCYDNNRKEIPWTKIGHSMHPRTRLRSLYIFSSKITDEQNFLKRKDNSWAVQIEVPSKIISKAVEELAILICGNKFPQIPNHYFSRGGTHYNIAGYTEAFACGVFDAYECIKQAIETTKKHWI